MSKRQIKKEYKKLKKLYSKSYGSSEDGVEPLKKEYDKLHQSIDENINKIIDRIIDGRMKKTPNYDEKKDRKIFKKMNVLSDDDKTNTTYSEKYEHLQSASDKELKLIEKILRKQLGYFKRTSSNVPTNFVKEYIFIRIRMHYRNVMNKAIGIDLQKFYIKYAPPENSAKKQEIFKNIQIKVEQLSKPVSMEKLRELYEYSGNSVETKSIHSSLTADEKKTKSGSFNWETDSGYSTENTHESIGKTDSGYSSGHTYESLDFKRGSAKNPESLRKKQSTGQVKIAEASNSSLLASVSADYNTVDSKVTSSTKDKQQFSLVRDDSKEKAKEETKKQLRLRDSNRSLTNRDSRESFA